MPTEIKEIVGRPFVGRHTSAAPTPVIVKALDVTDMCPMKYGGRTSILYALIDGQVQVAFVVSGRRDPLDGVCSAMSINSLTGEQRLAHRRQLYSFARTLGVNPGPLIELALIHQPSSPA